MTSHRHKTLQAISELLCYPTETYVEAAELLYVILQAELPEAAQCIARFGATIEPRDLHELEESYARTFDINPACALEVGWHLFGEDYARGSLLVRLRNEMRALGVEESAELPDHIAHVLALVAAMSDEEARRFVGACVLPALDKMQKALDDAQNAYGDVIRCLLIVLEHQFGRAENSDEDSPAKPADGPRGDPLRDFPMPCGTAGPVEFVPLHMNYPEHARGVPLASVSQETGTTVPDRSTPDVHRDRPPQGNRHG